MGNFIRQKRESLGLSQRALGQRFSPPVTTQFISNVERGVTPLPPSHVKALTDALQIPDAEILSLLEQEYAAKLSGRLGSPEVPNGEGKKMILVSPHDSAFLEKLIKAYQNADPETRKQFGQACSEILKLS